MNTDRPRPTTAQAAWNTPRNPWRLPQVEVPAECPVCLVYAGHRFSCSVGGGTGRQAHRGGSPAAKEVP
jgi:hypothetical protein